MTRSGGSAGLRGYVYQQHYVAYRVACSLAAQQLADYPKDLVLHSFKVEGRATGRGPVWDVILTTQEGGQSLLECKATEITAEDRRVFYARVRQEVAAGSDPREMVTGFVTDPGKNFESALSKLRGIAGLAEGYRSGVPNTPLRTVRSGENALQEALHHLCGSGAASTPSLDLEQALELLARFDVYEVKGGDLREAFKRVASVLFESGTGEAILNLVTGTLSNKVACGVADYSIEDFKSEIGDLHFALGTGGACGELLKYDSGAALPPNKPRAIVWRGLPGQPKTCWSLDERIANLGDKGSCVVMGSQGMGKTVSLLQAFEEAKSGYNHHHIFWMKASTLRKDKIESLHKLALLLSGIAPVWIAIDGLDEVTETKRKSWQRAIGYLRRVPQTDLLVSVRTEVEKARPWIQNCLKGMDFLDIGPLSAEQVKQAFASQSLPMPANSQLLGLLENPLLLSIYAGIVTPKKLPFGDTGMVAAYDIIERFLDRAVECASEGQRVEGDATRQRANKRHARAYIAEQTMDGLTVFGRPEGRHDLDAGIDMLVHEGVLAVEPPQRVRWVHEWLREYALITQVVRKITRPSAKALAEAVCSMPEEALARTAAAAGVRWLAARGSEWGNLTDYLVELHNQEGGLALEALAVAICGPQETLQLERLGDDLLVEAIEFARQLGASQWAEQVVALSAHRFVGPRGRELLDLLVSYGLQGVPDEQQAQAVEAAVQRFELRTERGEPVYPDTLRSLAEFIREHTVFQSTRVRRWLASLELGPYDGANVLEVVWPLWEGGYREDALAVARSLAWLDKQHRWQERFTPDQYSDHLIQKMVDEIFVGRHAVSNHTRSWGALAIELLSKLLLEHERHEKTSLPRFAEVEAQIEGTPQDEGDKLKGVFRADFDNYTADHYYEWEFDEQKDYHIVARAIETELMAASKLPKPDVFSALARQLMATKWGLAVCLPLQVLFDVMGDPTSARPWHVQEALELLTDLSVAGYCSSSEWRCLLRGRLSGTLSESQRHEVANAVRVPRHNEFVMLWELSLLQDWGVLTDSEQFRVEQLTKENEHRLVDPRDRKEHHRVRGVSAATRPFKDIFGAVWPDPSDHEAILRLEFHESEKLARDSDEFAADLLDRATILRGLTTKPELWQKPWVSHALGWHTHVLVALKGWACPPERHWLECTQYFAVLNEYLPGWETAARRALELLEVDPPESHCHGDAEQPSWGNSDWSSQALRYLDELLATWAVGRLAELRVQLGEAVARRWPVWSPITKALALCHLRDFHWAHIPDLRGALDSTFCLEDDPDVLRWASLKRGIYDLGGRIRRFRLLLAHANEGDRWDELLNDIGEFAGAWEMYLSDRASGAEAFELDGLITGIDGAETRTRRKLAAAVVAGSKQQVERTIEPSRIQAACFVGRSEWALDVLLPDDEEAGRGSERWVGIVNDVVKARWQLAERRFLAGKLWEGIARVIREGSIGAFHLAHHWLPEWVGQRKERQGKGPATPLEVPLPLSDQAIVAICRACAERLKQGIDAGVPRKEAQILIGGPTGALTTALYDICNDRVHVGSQLLAVVDILAAAGCTPEAVRVKRHLSN